MAGDDRVGGADVLVLGVDGPEAILVVDHLAEDGVLGAVVLVEGVARLGDALGGEPLAVEVVDGVAGPLVEVGVAPVLEVELLAQGVVGGEDAVLVVVVEGGDVLVARGLVGDVCAALGRAVGGELALPLVDGGALVGSGHVVARHFPARQPGPEARDSLVVLHDRQALVLVADFLARRVVRDVPDAAVQLPAASLLPLARLLVIQRPAVHARPHLHLAVVLSLLDLQHVVPVVRSLRQALFLVLLVVAPRLPSAPVLPVVVHLLVHAVVVFLALLPPVVVL